LEHDIAGFHGAAAGLLFNSGYDANLGLLSSVPQKDDTILYDSLSHASIRDGMRLSRARSFAFHHNDVEHLSTMLRRATGNVFVVTESLFSMDGDLCPLSELAELCRRHGAHLIVDEAHATGIIGERGEGWVASCGLGDACFARIHTFGKACGVHGAIVLGSSLLRDYLINFARPFVYTTALPEITVNQIAASYRLFPGMTQERMQLASLVNQFTGADFPFERVLSRTPIQGILVPGNSRARAVAARLQEVGLDVRAILYPTVPEGKERLRIVFHAFNTDAETNKLLNCLKNSG
jgi:8-amino-7-oxononanoate synthase